MRTLHRSHACPVRDEAALRLRATLDSSPSRPTLLALMDAAALGIFRDAVSMWNLPSRSRPTWN